MARKVKALVLFSGGLDSRLAVRLLKEQGIEVEAVFFLLPFLSFKIPEFKNKLHILDCRKGKLFREYIEIVRKPKFGTGVGMNPCIDCRIFLLREAGKVANKIDADFIATGDVLGERPMSQTSRALRIIDKEIGLEILRPLSAKLLPVTQAEKKGLIDREKLLNIQGRQRKRQMGLARKFKIKYPAPAGGCLLCEKEYASKLRDLFRHKNKINFSDIEVLNIGRHFRNKGKIVLGRDKEENMRLEKLNKRLKYNIIVPKVPGPTGIFENKKDMGVVGEMIKAYSSGDLRLRKKFERYRV